MISALEARRLALKPTVADRLVYFEREIRRACRNGFTSTVINICCDSGVAAEIEKVLRPLGYSVSYTSNARGVRSGVIQFSVSWF